MRITLKIKIVLPDFRKNEHCNNKFPSINYEFQEGLKEHFHYVPSKAYDDEFILNFAYSYNALIVSNDGFKDFRKINQILFDYATEK